MKRFPIEAARVELPEPEIGVDSVVVEDTSKPDDALGLYLKQMGRGDPAPVAERRAGPGPEAGASSRPVSPIRVFRVDPLAGDPQPVSPGIHAGELPIDPVIDTITSLNRTKEEIASTRCLDVDANARKDPAAFDRGLPPTSADDVVALGNRKVRRRSLARLQRKRIGIVTELSLRTEYP